MEYVNHPKQSHPFYLLLIDARKFSLYVFITLIDDKY